MGCGPKRMKRSGSGHTNGSTTPVFSALTEALSTADYEAVKVSMEVLDLSNSTTGGNAEAEVVPALSYSNDRVSWGTAVAMGSYTSTEGWSYGDSFTTLSVDKRFVRVGVLVRQTSTADGSNNENVRVNLDIDLKPR